MWRGIPPFSSSVGERKLMTHFVVKTIIGSAPQTRAYAIRPLLPVRYFAYFAFFAANVFFPSVAALPRWALCGEIFCSLWLKNPFRQQANHYSS